MGLIAGQGLANRDFLNVQREILVGLCGGRGGGAANPIPHTPFPQILFLMIPSHRPHSNQQILFLLILFQLIPFPQIPPHRPHSCRFHCHGPHYC